MGAHAQNVVLHYAVFLTGSNTGTAVLTKFLSGEAVVSTGTALTSDPNGLAELFHPLRILHLQITRKSSAASIFVLRMRTTTFPKLGSSVVGGPGLS